MPPYVPENVVAGGQIDPEKLNQELMKIAAAYNTHETSDFPANCVPVTAVVADQAQSEINFGREGNQAGITLIGVQIIDIVVPFDCTLLGGWAILRVNNNSPAGTTESNIYHETDATYLWASNVVLAEDGEPVNAGAPAKTDLTEGDVLTLRLAIPAGETIDDVEWALLVESQHQS